MLLRFRVKNFLSFNELTEFSMYSGKTRRFPDHIHKINDVSITKLGVIYGANASGKSNLIKSMDFAKDVIINGLDTFSLKNKNFRLAKDFKYNSYFDFDFIIDKKCYSYGFEINMKEKKILEEWLYEVNKNGEKLIFERDTKKKKITTSIKFSNEAAKTRFEIYSEDIGNNFTTLFLSDIAIKNIKKISEFSVFNKVYNWFSQTLQIVYPESKYAGIPFINKSEPMMSTYKELLQYFDTGICDIKTIDIPFDTFQNRYTGLYTPEMEEELELKKSITLNIDENIFNLNKNNKGELSVIKIGTIHKSSDNRTEIFDFSDESDGTRRLFDLIPIINKKSNNNQVFVIDEIDRSLHPNLVFGFIKYYLEAISNKNQLIITTHDSNLLDQNLLRRDEIWFVKKNIDQSSQVYSLDEFQDRFDKDIQKAYLQGRYGAIPHIKDSYMNYLDEKHGKN